jgi:two-component sensor histidine kinase
MSVSPNNDSPIIEPQPGGDDRAEVTYRALLLRIRQQEILAELGVLALQGVPFPDLMERTTVLTAEGLQADFCKVLKYLPDQKRLLVRAGVGWGPGVVGEATVGADLESPAGFALRTGKPVISNHLGQEERFRTPELFLEYGIRRAMNVILQGDGDPYGVLEVDSKSDGEFTEHDLAFLQGAANLLGMAIERQRIEENLKAALDRQEILLQEGNHRVTNSLQLVSSMLGLQAASAETPELRFQLQEAVTRITAIARAHQRLYRTRQIQSLDIGEYLADICNDIDELAAHCEVHVALAEGIVITTDRAISIALLVNELITNAAKHAYAQGEPCPIWVTLKRKGTDAIAISIRDEGKGLAADFDHKKSKGLGMRIVSAFLDQLEASLRVERRTPGTDFIIEIPLKATPDAATAP